MTPTQYKNARTRLGLTQQKLAKKLDIDTRQVGRRESGEQPIRLESQLAMKWLLQQHTKNKKSR